MSENKNNLENIIFTSIFIILFIILSISFIFKGVMFFLLITSSILMFMQNLFSSAALSKFNIIPTEDISQKFNDIHYTISNLTLSFTILKVLISTETFSKIFCWTTSLVLTFINLLTPLGITGIKFYTLPFLILIVFAIFTALKKIENLFFTHIKNKLN